MKRTLFIATPISAFGSNEELFSFRSWLNVLIHGVKKECPGLSIEAEVLGIESSKDYDDPESSVVNDLAAIERCTHFMMIYPKPLASSALIELGYALAKEKPVLIMTRSIDDLPSVIRLRYEQNDGVDVIRFKEGDGMLSTIKNFLNKSALF